MGWARPGDNGSSRSKPVKCTGDREHCTHGVKEARKIVRAMSEGEASTSVEVTDASSRTLKRKRLQAFLPVFDAEGMSKKESQLTGKWNNNVKR